MVPGVAQGSGHGGSPKGENEGPLTMMRSYLARLIPIRKNFNRLESFIF
jgi:hypothetical protein